MKDDVGMMSRVLSATLSNVSCARHAMNIFRDLGFGSGHFGIVLLAALCLPPALRAAETDDFSLRGFGTVGVVQTSSGDAEFVRDLSQPKGAKDYLDARVDSILGLQANWRLMPGLEAVVQATTHYRYDKSFRPDLSWAYLKYDPTPQVSLRAGRLATEFFMSADSRQIGYSYLTVRPPSDFFWYLPFSGINGVDAALTLPAGDDVVRGKVFYGYSQEHLPYADQYWNIDDSQMFGAYVDYLRGPWQFRASYARIRFNHNMPITGLLAPYVAKGYLSPAQVAAASDYLAIDNSRTHYYSLGAVYDDGPWQVQLMLNRIDQGARVFESSYGGYVLAGYRIGEVTPYLGYSWVHSEARQKPADPFSAKLMADFHANQNTGIFGARWDVARNVALKAQWDAIRGKPDSLLPYRGEKPSWSGKMDVFSLTMDFIF